MEIIMVDALPIVIARIRISKINKEKGPRRRSVISNAENEFYFLIDRELAGKLSIGQTIDLVFIPANDISGERGLLLLVKKGETDEILIGQDSPWKDYYYKKLRQRKKHGTDLDQLARLIKSEIEEQKKQS